MKIQILKFFSYILLILAYLLSWPAIPSDFEKEKRWANQVIDSLFDGEPVYLKADQYEFLALYMEPADKSTIGIILMHGTGVHPDWQTVINPLRVGLAEQGYHTLSIQMPILENEAEQQDYVDLIPQVPSRINASINHLKDLGIIKIHLIGHSLGAAMGTYYLKDENINVDGFIAIGLSTGIKNTHMDNLANLSTVQTPMHDLYGSDDLEDIVLNAEARKQASQNNHNYTQIQVDRADHFFDGEEEDLLVTVSIWLNSN